MAQKVIKSVRLDNDQIPLHYQIADYLIFMLQKGDLDREDKLPTEEMLTKIFGVSRTTIRKALEHLLKKELIFRKQGKGTFWTDSSNLLVREKLSGINRQIFAVNETTTVKVLSRTSEKVSRDIGGFLKLEVGEEAAVFRRIRYINREPMSYTVNYLHPSIGDRITKKNLEQKTMLETLEIDLSIPLGTISHEVEITRATSEISEILKVAVLDPVLTIRTLVYDAAGSPVEYVWTYFTENKYKFRVVLDNEKLKALNRGSMKE